MPEHDVFVHNTKCAVRVEQTTKGKWVATGDYRGRSVRAEGRTSGAAIRSWAEQARYSENFIDGA